MGWVRNLESEWAGSGLKIRLCRMEMVGLTTANQAFYVGEVWERPILVRNIITFTKERNKPTQQDDAGNRL